MTLRDAIQKASQILDEERRTPTVNYDLPSTVPTDAALLGAVVLANERGRHPREVRENPQRFEFKSVNFDLLCALLDQLHEQDRTGFLAQLRSRILDSRSYRHKFTEPILGAGTSDRCSSELPLVAEFLVRRGDRQGFINALHEAAPSPGLTLLLLELEEMIALNFTLFTEVEYSNIRWAMVTISKTIEDLNTRPRLTCSPNSAHN